MYFHYALVALVYILHQSILISAGDEKLSGPCPCDMSASKSMSDIYVQHSMHRIKDPEISLQFYTEGLGMTLLDTVDLAMDTKVKFTLYFLAYEDPKNIPTDDEERLLWAMSYPGAVNLEYIWGDNVTNHEYHDTNASPTGYSHIGIFATDVYKVCERLIKFNATFIKKPDEGVTKGIAFLLDPNGYWIEIANPYIMARDAK